MQRMYLPRPNPTRRDPFGKGMPFQRPKGLLRRILRIGIGGSLRERHPLGKTNSFNQKQKHLLLNLKMAGFVMIWLNSKEKRFAIQNL